MNVQNIDEPIPDVYHNCYGCMYMRLIGISSECKKCYRQNRMMPDDNFKKSGGNNLENEFVKTG